MSNDLNVAVARAALRKAANVFVESHLAYLNAAVVGARDEVQVTTLREAAHESYRIWRGTAYTYWHATGETEAADETG